MPSITIKKIDGSDGGNLELSEAVFEAPQNKVLVREALNAYLANQRQGNASTKTRGMVRGGGRKPWRQKGTGRARQGSIRAPQWRGGAIIFGPQPRDYRVKFPRKKRQGALRAVLSARREEGNLIVLENVQLKDMPRTKSVTKLLDDIKAEGRVLFVLDDTHLDFIWSARNIPYVDVVTAREINVYDLLVADTVVLTKAAVELIEEAAI